MIRLYIFSIFETLIVISKIQRLLILKRCLRQVMTSLVGASDAENNDNTFQIPAKPG